MARVVPVFPFDHDLGHRSRLMPREGRTTSNRMRSLLVPVLVVLFAACGGNRTEPAAPSSAPAPAASPAPSASTSSAVVAPGEAKVGDKTLCLISKEEFVVTASSPKVEYEGKTYYFCCPGCDSKFKADPKKYLSK